MIEINSVNELLEYLPRSDDLEGGPIFRGQGQSWPLVPALFRDGHAALNFGGWTRYEETLIRLFTRESEPHLTFRPESLTEWIVLGQHYGLPTRCLDWSRSPLVALYFAVEDLDEGHDGIIWSYEPRELRFSTELTWNDLRDLADVFVFPMPHKFGRVVSQRACVTVHPLPVQADAFVPFEQSFKKVVASELSSFAVPGKSKFKLLRDLTDAGVSVQHIYPGLDGLCQDIVWRLKRLRTQQGSTNRRLITRKFPPGSLEVRVVSQQQPTDDSIQE